MKITLDINIDKYNKLKQELEDLYNEYGIVYKDYELVNTALNYMYNEKANTTNIKEINEIRILIQLLMEKYNELSAKMDMINSKITNKDNELSIFARNAFIDMENNKTKTRVKEINE